MESSASNRRARAGVRCSTAEAQTRQVNLDEGKDDETVVFSWILWPSRVARDDGMKKVMADPRLKPDVNPIPFDGKRLIYGGFEVIVEA